jgi:hypothetical protein
VLFSRKLSKTISRNTFKEKKGETIEKFENTKSNN